MITLDLKVIPSSGRQALIKDKSGIIKCYLKSAPEKGKANTELIGFIARLLKIPKEHISIKRGATGRKKCIAIALELTYDELLQRLGIDNQHSFLRD